MLRRLLNRLWPDDRDARIVVLEAEVAELRRRVRFEAYADAMRSQGFEVLVWRRPERRAEAAN